MDIVVYKRIIMVLGRVVLHLPRVCLGNVLMEGRTECGGGDPPTPTPPSGFTPPCCDRADAGGNCGPEAKVGCAIHTDYCFSKAAQGGSCQAKACYAACPPPGHQYPTNCPSSAPADCSQKWKDFKKCCQDFTSCLCSDFLQPGSDIICPCRCTPGPAPTFAPTKYYCVPPEPTKPPPTKTPPPYPLVQIDGAPSVPCDQIYTVLGKVGEGAVCTPPPSPATWPPSPIGNCVLKEFNSYYECSPPPAVLPSVNDQGNPVCDSTIQKRLLCVTPTPGSEPTLNQRPYDPCQKGNYLNYLVNYNKTDVLNSSEQYIKNWAEKALQTNPTPSPMDSCCDSSSGQTYRICDGESFTDCTPTPPSIPCQCTSCGSPGDPRNCRGPCIAGTECYTLQNDGTCPSGTYLCTLPPPSL